jgi:hypothetical protein
VEEGARAAGAARPAERRDRAERPDLEARGRRLGATTEAAREGTERAVQGRPEGASVRVDTRPAGPGPPRPVPEGQVAAEPAAPGPVRVA